MIVIGNKLKNDCSPGNWGLSPNKVHCSPRKGLSSLGNLGPSLRKVHWSSRMLPFSLKNLDSSLRKIHCSVRIFFNSLHNLFFEVFHFFLVNFFVPWKIHIVPLGNLIWTHIVFYFPREVASYKQIIFKNYLNILCTFSFFLAKEIEKKFEY